MACEIHVLQAFDGAHVLGAFEGLRIRAAELAHAALNLQHRFIFVIFKPSANASFDVRKVPHAVEQESGAEHGHIGADHQQFDYVFGFMHSGGGS